MSIEYYFYYLYYTFLGWPFVLRVVSIALTLFIPLYLCAGYVFFRHRRRFYRQKKKENRLEKKYKEKIAHVISSEKLLTNDDFDTLFDSKIKKTNKKEKKLLSKIVSSVYHSASFVNDRNTQQLLSYLQLFQFWEKQLKQGNLIQKHNSLRRFNELNTRVSGAVLTGLTYNKNDFLRKRSRSAYLLSTPNAPFRFFEEDFDKNMNKWDQIDLHNALEERWKKGELPNLIQWVLRSKDCSFQCFLVNEIAFFKQEENAPALIQLVNDDATDPRLRECCIRTLGKLGSKEAEPHLLTMYHTQPLFVQDRIIQVVGELATGKALPFLTEVYKETVDDEKRLMVLSVIYHYKPDGRNRFQLLKEKEHPEKTSTMVFDHVSNPLLST